MTAKLQILANLVATFVTIINVYSVYDIYFQMNGTEYAKQSIN